MKFYLRQYKGLFESKVEFPCFALVKDSWNDFGYYILYTLIYHETKDDIYEIGNIKILDSNTPETRLSSSFERLEENYCSLGQSLEYYSALKEKFPNNFEEILKSLNDIAFDKRIAEKFKDNVGLTDGLLRFTSAQKAFEDAAILLLENRRRVNENLHFTYYIKLDGAEDNHKVDFDFIKSDELPYRINVLVGKNGTGKTQFLGSMVNSISGILNKENFTPYNPLFNKVIAISYSLFDDFPKPPETTAFNYKYIGLRCEDEEVISDIKLSEKLRDALRKINASKRSEDWFRIVNEIIKLENLGLFSHNDITTDWINNISYEKSKRLSSGQSIVLFILTELIAHIQEESLILFDEPETHLHPSAVSKLLKGFYEILTTYKSFSILSTHSPVILQDIPSHYITIFDREGNLPKIRKLPIETFGENVSTITSTVFEVIDVKEMYKLHFEKLIETYTPEQINSFFNDKLSFNSQLYLAALDKAIRK